MKKNLGLFKSKEGDAQLCTDHWRQITGGDIKALQFVKYLDDQDDECDLCSGLLEINQVKEVCLI